MLFYFYRHISKFYTYIRQLLQFTTYIKTSNRTPNALWSAVAFAISYIFVHFQAHANHRVNI